MAKLRAVPALVLLLATVRLASAMPPEPQANAPWFSTPLYGGPTFAVSVSTNQLGRQLVFLGGEQVFIASRGASWQATTPSTGRISSLVAADGGAAFAANDKGEGFRTTDAGRGWSPQRLRGTEPVRFLATSANFKADGVAFGITTNDWRLYRTDKGSSNWIEVVYVTDVAHQTGAIALSPLVRADETIFAGTNRGIYKSTNKGQTWQLWCTPTDGAPVFGQDGGPADGQGLVLPLAYGDDPDSSTDTDLRTLFAYNNQGIFRSEDDGKTWGHLGLAAGRVRGLALSNNYPQDPTVMAAVSGAGKVVAVSGDRGDTWRLVDGPDGINGTGVAMALDFARVVKDRDPRRRYLFLPLVMKQAGRPGPPAPPQPPDNGSREAYLSTDGDGVWRTRDAGATWSREWAGLANAQPTSLAFLPGPGSDATVLVGTRAAGLYRSLDGGRSNHWQPAGVPRGVNDDVNALAVSPAFAADQTVYLAATSGLWRSADGGVTWEQTAGPAPSKWVSLSPAFATDHTVIANGRISHNGGQSWEDLPTVDGPVAFSPTFATDQTLWAGGAYLRRSEDDGKTWTDFQGVTVLRNRPVYAVAALQVVPGEYRIFVGTDRGIVQSRDNGKNWQSVGVTSRPVRGIAFSITQIPQGALVAAAAEDGVAWSVTRGESWGKTPASPKPATAVTTSSDATTILSNAPLRSTRYGYGNSRAALPYAFQPYARQ